MTPSIERFLFCSQKNQEVPLNRSCQIGRGRRYQKKKQSLNTTIWQSDWCQERDAHNVNSIMNIRNQQANPDE
jgi:hypothetical protein